MSLQMTYPLQTVFSTKYMIRLSRWWSLWAVSCVWDVQSQLNSHHSGLTAQLQAGNDWHYLHHHYLLTSQLMFGLEMESQWWWWLWVTIISSVNAFGISPIHHIWHLQTSSLCSNLGLTMLLVIQSWVLNYFKSGCLQFFVFFSNQLQSVSISHRAAVLYHV